MRDKGFINIILVIMFFLITVFIGWGIIYINRLNRDMKFNQEVDKLAFESANYEAFVLNGMTLSNDAILTIDALAGLIAGGSAGLGGLFILSGYGAGQGIDLIKQGVDIAKKTLKVGGYVEDFQKKFLSLGTVAPYIPLVKRYIKSTNGVILLPLPLIPDFSSSSTNNNKKNLTISYDVKWDLTGAINGLVLEGINRLKSEYNKSKSRLFPDSKSLKGKQKFCDATFKTFYSKNKLKKLKKTAAGKKLIDKTCNILWKKMTGQVYKQIKKSAIRAMDTLFDTMETEIVSGINDYSFKGSSKGDFKIPVPAVSGIKIYSKQKIGILGIFKTGGLYGVNKRNLPNIPYRLIFSQARPYSNTIAGGVPVVPDWKGVFTRGDILKMIIGNGD